MGLFKRELIEDFQTLVNDKRLRVATVRRGRTDNTARLQLVNVLTGELISFFIETAEDPSRLLQLEHGLVLDLSVADERSTFGRGWSRRLSNITVGHGLSGDNEQIITVQGI